MKNREKKGFTLIELIMVIVILGILAAVAIPKFVDLSTQANQAACDGVRGGVASACAIYYAKMAANGNTLGFPADLTGVGAQMADGQTPVCPAGTAYTYDSATGTVAAHTH